MKWSLVRSAAALIAAAATVTAARAQTPATGALARIADTGRIRLGSRVDARPFSYRDESGHPAGYSIALCEKVAAAIKDELHLPALSTEWVTVTASERFEAVRQHTVDILCGADTVTLGRRKTVGFSIPIFPGGVGVMVRSDAPAALKNVLGGKGQPFRPTWRASASDVLQFKAFAAVESTTAERWLRQRIDDLNVVTTVAPVATYDAGLDALLSRRADALFGERAMLLDMARRRSSSGDVVVLDRLFTTEPLAFALPAGDEPFRLIVDGTLAQFYSYGPLSGLYARWFGKPDESAITFFRWNAIPD